MIPLRTASGADDHALRLPNTLAGQTWLEQFHDDERETAIRLLAALTLVSHSAFERELRPRILAEAEAVDGPVALYATREVESGSDYFAVMANPAKPLEPLDAVGRGPDLGSEARIATIIRNLSRTAPQKLLSHPSLEKLRQTRAKAIFCIDDIVGSGRRTATFLSSIWRSATVKSWHSRHQVRLGAIAYTGTESGVSRLQKLKFDPLLSIIRDCPTYDRLPWRDDISEAIRSLCDRYGRLTSRPTMRLGYRESMAALVFEHGCPNNTPAILWAPTTKKRSWTPLFPSSVVLPDLASAFPPDITARNPIDILNSLVPEESLIPLSVGDGTPLGFTTVAVLSYVASGVRSRSALSFATGYNARECTALLDRCIMRGYLTATLRLTAAGRAELRAAGRPNARMNGVPPRGDDAYYPKQLRRPGSG